MKQKISVSLDEETIAKVQSLIITGIFRNKSHVVEFAIHQLDENDIQ